MWPNWSGLGSIDVNYYISFVFYLLTLEEEEKNPNKNTHYIITPNITKKTKIFRWNLHRNKKKLVGLNENKKYWFDCKWIEWSHQQNAFIIANWVSHITPEEKKNTQTKSRKKNLLPLPF